MVPFADPCCMLTVFLHTLSEWMWTAAGHKAQAGRAMQLTEKKDGPMGNPWLFLPDGA